MTYPYPSQYPSQYPTPGGTAQPKHLRGFKILWIALAMFIVAVILFVTGGIIAGTKSLGKVNGFQRVSISSGGGNVTLNGTGKWVGYYEGSDVSSSMSTIPAFRVVVTSPSNQDVTVQNYGNRKDGKVKRFTYDHDGHKGVATFQFTVTETGTYQVRLQAVDSLPQGADVAIGRDIVGETVAAGLLIIVGVLFFIAAIVLLIVGLVRRSRHKNELTAVYGGAGPYGGPPQPWPPAPQQWPGGAQPGTQYPGQWPQTQQPGAQQPWPPAQPPGAQPPWPPTDPQQPWPPANPQ